MEVAKDSMLVMKVVDFIVAAGTKITTNGSYNVYYDDVSHLLSVDEYKEYFSEIVKELASRKELLDVDADGSIGEIFCLFGLNYCPNYEWSDGDERTFGCSREEWEKREVKPVEQRANY